MKKLLLSITTIALITPSFSANFESDVKSKIKNVTVYLSGAQVARKGYVTFKKGVNTFVFDGVSPYVNQNTIQVSGAGDYIILDSKKTIKYPQKTWVILI